MSVSLPLKCSCGRTCNHGGGYYCTSCDGSGPPMCYCGNPRFGVQGRLCEACLIEHYGPVEFAYVKDFAEKQMRRVERRKKKRIRQREKLYKIKSLLATILHDEINIICSYV